MYYAHRFIHQPSDRLGFSAAQSDQGGLLSDSHGISISRKVLGLLLMLVGCLSLGHSGTAWAELRDIVLLVDNSTTMQASDPDKRLGAILQSYLQDQSTDSRVGALVYTDYPVLVKPLEQDSDQWGAQRTLLQTLDYSAQHSNSAAALERALYEFEQRGRPDVQQQLVWIAGNRIDTGSADQDREFNLWAGRVLSEQAQKAGVMVVGIAFGKGADQALVENVAVKSGGAFFAVSSVDELQQILSKTSKLRAKSAVDLQNVITGTEKTETEVKSLKDDLSESLDIVEIELDSNKAPVPSAGDIVESELEPSVEHKAATPVLLPESLKKDGSSIPVSDADTGEAVTMDARFWMLVLAVPVALFVCYELFRAFMRRTQKSIEPTYVEAGRHVALLEDLSGSSREAVYDITQRTVNFTRTPSPEINGSVAIVIERDVISKQHAVIQYDHGYYCLTITAVPMAPASTESG